MLKLGLGSEGGHYTVLKVFEASNKACLNTWLKQGINIFRTITCLRENWLGLKLSWDWGDSWFGYVSFGVNQEPNQNKPISFTHKGSNVQ